MEKQRVLFLCTGNSARSQMAEALLRDRAGDRFEALSAGLEPGRVHPMTLQVLTEEGLPTDGLRSKGVDEFLEKLYIHYVITVCDDADRHCPRVWPLGGARLHWSIHDPVGVPGSEAERLQAFRDTRDELARRVDEFIAEHGMNGAGPGE